MKLNSIATTGAAALALLLSVANMADAQARKPGYLGIRFQERVTRVNDASDERVIVSDVSKDSPAEKAGVRSGDEILRVNGLVATNGKFAALARTLVEGDSVRLRLKRDGREHDATIVAAERPAGYGKGFQIVIGADSIRRRMRDYLDSARVHIDSLRLPRIEIVTVPDDSAFTFRISPFRGVMPDSFIFKGDSALSRLYRVRPDVHVFAKPGEFRFEGDLGPGAIFRGIEVGARAIGGAEFTEMDRELAEYFDAEQGVLTLRVLPETPADRAGLQSGDVIVKAKDRAVTRVAELRSIVANNPDGVKLEIVRKGKQQTLELKTRR